MDDIDREITFREIKAMLRMEVSSARCRPDNDALNQMTDFLINVYEQEKKSPIENTKAFLKMIRFPSHDPGVLMARRLFFERATGGKFSGG